MSSLVRRHFLDEEWLQLHGLDAAFQNMHEEVQTTSEFGWYDIINASTDDDTHVCNYKQANQVWTEISVGSVCRRFLEKYK